MASSNFATYKTRCSSALWTLISRTRLLESAGKFRTSLRDEPSHDSVLIIRLRIDISSVSADELSGLSTEQPARVDSCPATCSALTPTTIRNNDCYVRRNSRFSIALHALIQIAEWGGAPVTSEQLAACLLTNPVVVR